MKLTQLAAQCYTIREFCGDAASFAASMKKVKAIGYAAVQISGVGPIPAPEIAKIVTGEGLRVCATHEGGESILNETQKVIDRLAALGTAHTAYPYPHVPLTTVEEVRALAKGLDKAGAAMRAAGQVLTYHNHAVELTRLGATTVLDILYDETDPRNLQGEIDTYWVQAGGGDPVAWCAVMAWRPSRRCGRAPRAGPRRFRICLSSSAISPSGSGRRRRSRRASRTLSTGIGSSSAPPC